MALIACLLPRMQQAQRIDPALKPRQRVVRRAGNQVCRQRHFARRDTVKRGAREQMARQLPLTHRPHLQVGITRPCKSRLIA